MVDLQEIAATVPAIQLPSSPPAASAPAASVFTENSAPGADAQQTASPTENSGPKKVENDAVPAPVQEMAQPPSIEVAGQWSSDYVQGEILQVSAAQRPSAMAEALLPPLRKARDFLATDRERLTYRISMMGIPVGSAELEAGQENGEVRITLRIQSNAAISELYPVDDRVETRHIGGNFILCRIRQREGSFRGDRGFTLFLRDKSVFWIDRLKNLSITEPLPNSAVVDVLSGLYYLRNQTLEVRKPVILQLFDSNHYAATPVEVVRRERLKLPGLREVDTLLIQPHLRTDGIFRRTGNILVWLTDDRNKVPVKVETLIPLGKVTAELVSAESQLRGDPPAGTATRPGIIGSADSP
jgi:hypothetical protein